MRKNPIQDYSTLKQDTNLHKSSPHFKNKNKIKQKNCLSQSSVRESFPPLLLPSSPHRLGWPPAASIPDPSQLRQPRESFAGKDQTGGARVGGGRREGCYWMHLNPRLHVLGVAGGAEAGVPGRRACARGFHRYPSL